MVTAPIANDVQRTPRKVASTSHTAIGQGGVVHLPTPMPLEMMHKLERDYLTNETYFTELKSHAPRYLQELGGDAPNGKRARNVLLPWVNDRLLELEAPRTMTPSDSPVGILMISLMDTGHMHSSAGKLPAHQDYRPQLFPGETGWNLVVLLTEVDGSEACQCCWLGSRDAVDPTNGRDTRKWLDQNFTRMELTGPAGTVFVFDCAMWHAVERMAPPRTMSTRGCAAPAARNPAKRLKVEERVRVRTVLVLDCRTAGIPPPHVDP